MTDLIAARGKVEKGTRATTVIEVPLSLYTDIVRSLAVREDFVDPCAADATFENEARLALG